MKKILIISYYWDERNSIGRQRWFNFVNELIKKNIKVYVLTSSNENKIILKENLTIIKRKSFDINTIFSKLFSSNYTSGVVDTSESTSNKFFSWLRVNLFFPDPRILWANSSYKFLLKFIKSENINTIITTSPPHSIHTIGRNLKEDLGIKWISDFRDPYTNWDIFLNMKPLSFFKKIHKKIEFDFLTKSDHVLVTNSSLKDNYSEIIRSDKLSLLRNGSTHDFKKINYDSKFVISYFGLINKFRDPIIFLKVFDELLTQNKIFSQKSELRIYGKTQESTLKYLNNDFVNKKNIKIFGQIDIDHVNDKINESSILLLLLNNTQIQNTTPYKIYDYLISGRHILTLGDHKNTDVDYLLNKYNRNQRISYGDIELIKKYLIESFNDFNEKKLKDFKLNYSEIKYSNLIDSLIDSI